MDKNLESKLTKNIDTLSAGGQLALVICADAFRFGGNWGFIRSNRADFRDQVATLRTEAGSVKAIPVSNGALILADENFLAYNVNKAVPNALGRPFIEMAKQRKQDEQQRFVKFVNSVVKGKSSHVKHKDGYYELVLGLFCVNDTNAIRLNGVEYPSYKLNMIEALDYVVKAMQASGRKVYAKAITDTGNVTFELAINLVTNRNGLAALYRGLEIAESDTGVFLTIRIT